MRVRATFPGWDIEGDLSASFRDDGGEVIGRIDVLRMSAQGHSRHHATALLEKMFASYCEFMTKRGELYSALLRFGFRPVEESGTHGESQHLTISRVVDPDEVNHEPDKFELANA